MNILLVPSGLKLLNNCASDKCLRSDQEFERVSNIVRGMGPVDARPLQDARMNHSEQNREERPGSFFATRAPTGQHVKMFKQVRVPPAHVKERAYPKKLAQEGDAERYGKLKFRIDEIIFAAYDKTKGRRAEELEDCLQQRQNGH